MTPDHHAKPNTVTDSLCVLDLLDQLAEASRVYRTEAYAFVLETISRLMQRFAAPRHVTGRELLDELKRYGLEQFGPLTKTVLEFWGVSTTQDFGAIVFQLVDAGLLGKTERDTPKDFENVYDFSHVFEKSYRYVD